MRFLMAASKVRACLFEGIQVTHEFCCDKQCRSYGSAFFISAAADQFQPLRSKREKQCADTLFQCMEKSFSQFCQFTGQDQISGRQIVDLICQCDREKTERNIKQLFRFPVSIAVEFRQSGESQFRVPERFLRFQQA